MEREKDRRRAKGKERRTEIAKNKKTHKKGKINRDKEILGPLLMLKIALHVTLNKYIRI